MSNKMTFWRFFTTCTSLLHRCIAAVSAADCNLRDVPMVPVEDYTDVSIVGGRDALPNLGVDSERGVRVLVVNCVNVCMSKW